MDLEYVWGIELIRIEDNEEDRKIENGHRKAKWACDNGGRDWSDSCKAKAHQGLPTTTRS